MRLVRMALLIVVPLALVLGGAAYWLRGGRTVGTENAYVKAHIAQIAPEISGRVADVLVQDHMAVVAGQVLVRIDRPPFELAFAKAKAELDAARITVETARAAWAETNSELGEVEARAEFLSRQAGRQRQLLEHAVVAVAKLEEAENAAAVARDRIVVVKRRRDRALAALAGDPQLPTDQHPLVRERKADLDRAELDLERTVITAPINGIAVAVKLQPGDPVKAATPLFVVVSDERPWVEANMKETDLTYVRVGQKASVILDIYPETVWEGEVESISPATGAEFAILPPQNASGNWVKVVQRLPVRVRLRRHTGEPPLRAGMTATVSIDTGRQRSFADALFGAAARTPAQ